MASKLVKKTYNKHENDVQSVQMWVVENKYKVFFYKEIGVEVEGNLQGNNMHFTIWDTNPMAKGNDVTMWP